MSHVDLKVGDCVLLSKTLAIVLYIGPVDWDDNPSTKYIGVELISPIPNGHNGCYNNKQYFKCKPNHGIILPISSVVRKIKPRELVLRLNQFKQSIKKAQHKQYNLTKTLQNLQSTNNNDKTVTNTIHNKNISVAIEGIITEKNHKNDNYNYMMLKSQQDNTFDEYSIKIEPKYIHYNNTINNFNSYMVHVANYWLNQFNIHSSIKIKTEMDIFEQLKQLKQNNISNILSLLYTLKDIYFEWYNINNSIKNNEYTEKCNGNILLCKCVYRIIIQLKLYTKFIESEICFSALSITTLSKIMNSFIGYSLHKLVEDWDHICNLHLYEYGHNKNNDKNILIDWTLEKQETFNFFENKLLNYVCNNVDKCKSFERIYRKDESEMNNTKDTIIQHQLDIIHNKIFHSNCKYEALGKYNSDEHNQLKQLIHKTKSNPTTPSTPNTPGKNTYITFDMITEQKQYDQKYIKDNYGVLPVKTRIDLEPFDKSKYYNKMHKISSKVSEKCVKELIPLYTKWHFFMQNSFNYDLIRNFPCDLYCEKQPCKIIKRMVVLMEFYSKWVNHTIDIQKYISCVNFIESLDLYDRNGFIEDFNHLCNFHLIPKQNEIFNHLLFCNWKKQKISIYEYVTNKIGTCNIKQCLIFQRYNTTKYDQNYYKMHKITLFDIKNKDINTVNQQHEIELQKKLDECHVMLFHSKKRYITMALQNTDEYKYFTDIIKQWEKCS